MSAQVWILIAAIAAVLLVALVAGFVRYRTRRVSLTPAEEPRELVDRSGGYTAAGGFTFSGGGAATAEPVPVERTDTEGQPHIGDDAAIPRDAPKRGITNVQLPAADVEQPADAALESETAPATDAVVVDSRVDSAAGVAESTTGSEAVSQSTTAEEDSARTATRASEAGESGPADAGSAPTSVASSATESPAPDTAATRAESSTAPQQSAPAETAEISADAAATTPPLDTIEPTTGRLVRLRGRLSRSQNAVGKSLLGLLGGGDLDEDSWEEIEDTLVLADLGTASTAAVVQRLREEMAARSVRTTDQARAVLREVLIEALRPELDRSVRALPHADHPSILLVVGVNGTGKTTTTGKLARVLVADGRRVLLGAADTFRAAAADQLQTWGERVGAETVRGREGADPAAVAFDAVAAGIDQGVDVVLIDTAGRLHTKTGLMDELGKVKRVVEKKAAVDEVLLVLDSTVGQNGLMQARVFAEVVDITGVVLTKLDGTAKGGIVFQVQHELGVPVKLVGLGEGADDLAPFEPAAFVDALLG
ncbi:signal recognition particle-docking protein FtsY [Nocardia panacis]|uniref:Signal recognition particle receptor FtsY n=1 Tax=Nocardia panacis TaxID=2340916 RepID=A0A3A4KKS3_9NOCA|nr:signal recognition particle-docking protein FtsY [Nocardia panacis]RJO75311.1 signal recognition particle-docking protein FtsY [Nocardia panacis]